MIYKQIKQTKPQLLVPTLSEFIVFTSISILIMCLLNFDKIINSFGLHISEVDLPERLASFYIHLFSGILPNLINILVWAFCGMGVYFILWVILDSIFLADETNTRRHRFVYPDEKNRRIFVFTVIGQLCVRFISGLAFIAWIFLLFKFLPIFNDYFYKDKLSVGTVIAPLMLATYLFLAAILLRLVILRPRVFTDTK